MAIMYESVDQAVAMVGKLFKDFEAAQSDDEDRFVTVLISNPGVGKSAAVDKMCRRMGYNIIQLNLACIEPSDIIGLGAREKMPDGSWQTVPAPPKWADKAMAGHCVIFVDEFNNTTPDVLAGFQKMFSDFVIDDRKLPRTTHIIGACNPPGEATQFAQRQLPGAFRRRLCMIPIKDDYKYVMKKHHFTMPAGYMETDNKDLEKYIAYTNMSSAIADNVYNISKYPNMTQKDKAVLISGFGSGAVQFAKDQNLISDKASLSSANPVGDDDYHDWQREWKKNPIDNVSPFQQVDWGTRKINGSTSYARSKNFLNKVENNHVYKILYGRLREHFPADYAIDESKLPESKDVNELDDNGHLIVKSVGDDDTKSEDNQEEE